MKNKMMKLIALCTTVCLFILGYSSAYGKEQADGYQVDAYVASITNADFQQIIGNSDSQLQTRIPNKLIVDWDATATQVIIYVTNIGIDPVDTFVGTVSVSGGSFEPFAETNLLPLSSRTIKVDLNMHKCYEDITVDYYAIDGGTDFGSNSSPGHREIPSSLSSIWVAGASSSVYESINYHYNKHSSDIGVSSTNIVDYATKAKAYRDTVVSDIATMTSTQLNSKYTITISTGATVSHKYKNNSTYAFAILSDTSNAIVSFGGQ